MNRAQIRRRVQGLLRDDTYPVDVINESLNRVLNDINMSGRFKFQQNIDTVTLVTGTYKYAVTSTILAEKLVVFQLANATDQAIIPKGPDMVDAIAAGAFLTTGDAPTTYFRWNDYWWVDPIPTATANAKTLSIFHFKDITALSSDITTPGIPTRYQDTLLVYGVAADIAPGLMVRTPEGSQEVNKAFQMCMRKFMAQELWDPNTNKQLIRDPRWKNFDSVGHVNTIR